MKDVDMSVRVQSILLDFGWSRRSLCLKNVLKAKADFEDIAGNSINTDHLDRLPLWSYSSEVEFLFVVTNCDRYRISAT